jgi:integrase
MGNLDSEALKGKITNAEVYVDWKRQLQDVLDKNLNTRANGNVASFATQSDRANFLFGFFKKLRTMGMKTEPRNLKEHHVHKVVLEWEKEGIKPATLQKYLSHLRQYCEWIGKRGMIREAEKYVVNSLSVERTYIATEDKSWDKTELDKYKILQEIFNKDQYVGIQIMMQDAFGLRRKEAICIRPYISEKEGFLHVSDGTKGGKSRIVPVDTDIKRAVLKKAQQFVNYTQAHLGNPKKNLEQNLTRYSNILRRSGVNKAELGITGHGLRAGFALRELEVRGLIPVLKGGKIGALAKEDERKIRMEVAELLGHHRTRVTTAYSGAETYYGLLKLSKYEAGKLEQIVSAMEVGKTYRFQTFEYQTVEGELIAAQKMDRVFLGTLQVEDRYFFEVERAVPLLEHAIALEHVKSITAL